MANPKPIPEPRDPPPETIPPPRPLADPSAATDLFKMASETGTMLPSVYGTARVAGNVIERYQGQVGTNQTAPWQPLSPYTSAVGKGIGALAVSNGNLYVVITEGTSAAGVPGQGLSGTGTDILDGTVHWAYTKMGYQHMVAIAFCEGQIFGVLKAWQDKLAVAGIALLPHVSDWIALFNGTPTGLTRPNWFPPSADNVVYSNTAVLLVIFTNGSDGSLPSVSVEIQGIFADATHADANPADIAIDLLTHVRRGNRWPAAMVDAVSTGSGAASWRTYCTAAGLLMSWAIDQQTSVKELLQVLLAGTNTDPVWTNRPDGLGGMLKFVPRGDQQIVGSVTYTPDFTPQYALSEADFLEPLQVTHQKSSNTWNSFPIEYTDRAQDYRRNIVDDPEMADVDLRGLRRQQTTSLPMVIAPASVMMLSRIFAQRSLNVRNTYTFKVGYRYLRLEPADVVTLSDSVMGLVARPVRILTKSEDQAGEGSFTFTAEDWPAGAGVAAAVAPQVGDGFKPNAVTPLQQIVLLPGQVPPGTVPDAGGTRGGQVDNIFPNHTSENAPPDGADTSKPEWVGRVSDAGAFAGSWVRQLTALTGARQLIGDVALDSATIIKPAYQSQLGLQIRCSPGESFFMGAQVRFVAPSTLGDAAGVGVAFLDAGKQLITASPMWGLALWGISLWGSAGMVSAPASFPSGWTRVTAFGVAPANAVYAHFYLWANSDQGQVTAQFDAIFAARQIESGLLQNPTWTAPAFLNGWGAAAGSTVAPGFFQNLFGAMLLRGTIANGTMGQAAFNLPVGSRPAADMKFGTDGNGAYARVTITAAGDVIPDIGTNVAISLDGITFDTRN